MNFESTLDYARKMDAADPLSDFRQQFYIPQKNGCDAIYLCGNSLGLQPKSVENHIKQELDDWKNLGVEGHVHAKNPWMYYHHRFARPLAHIVGAREKEVTAMNALSVNLHLLFASFYRPKGKRVKILVEGQLFPSDYFVVLSEVEQYLRLSGREDFKAEDAILQINPREHEYFVRDEDVLNLIEAHQDDLTMVLLGAVNYYNGQWFDMEAITKAGHAAGAMVGFDLAHAIGNVPMKLHDWQIDFSTWCSYKYLNSGPGGPSGIFVHERHLLNADTPQLKGWWGHEETSRFDMDLHFVPSQGADRWQMSNVAVLSLAAHKAALNITEEATLPALRDKSLKLTAFLEFLIRQWITEQIEIITPSDPEKRGCQLSLLTGKNGRQLFDAISAKGVIADWRKPNVIRIAPAPLYNTFEDVFRFANYLREACNE